MLGCHHPHGHYYTRYITCVRSNCRRADGLRIVAFQVFRSLAFAPLSLGLLIYLWIQRLNGFSEGHALGSSPCRARSALSCLAGHVRFQAAEADPQVFADMGSGHTLTEVLEAGTGLLPWHTTYPLNFSGHLRLLPQNILHVFP